ncbi:hypothetical protein I4U23_012950 [Adineta vaga]|nr:hypothetical protein I4U23_012950 [Adineta vaga]
MNLLVYFASILRKKTTIPGAEGYRELLQALVNNGRHIEYMAIEMLDNDDLFNRENVKTIRSLARESIVKISSLVDNKEFDLVIKCNERLDICLLKMQKKFVRA